MTDIAIYESFDGGDLIFTGNDLQTTDGITNQCYLALFGGMAYNGSWFGNAIISDEENKLTSTTEKTLREVALNSSGILAVENSVKDDLAFLSEYADIEVEVTLETVNRVLIEVTLTEPDNSSTKVKFIWDGQRNEVITQQ